MKEPITTIYLIRHAEAEGNTKEIFQGHSDGAVSEKGRVQLEALSERCRQFPFEAVYSSPLQRAHETAEGANLHYNLPIIVRDDLMEINGGVFEGNYWSELPNLFPDEYSVWENSHHDFTIENGESMREVFARITNAIDEIAKENQGKVVAVVSHGCAIRNYLCYASGWPIERVNEIVWCDNTAISRIDYDKNFTPHIIWQNDSSHLSEDYSTLIHQSWWRNDMADKGILDEDNGD